MSKELLGFILVLTMTTGAFAAGRPGGFAVLGPGGGGAMFHPTVSPHDPNTVLVACDMTGAYITHDGGRTWRMFNLRSTVRFFVFDPVDRNTIYAGTNALWRSTDGGETWKIVYPSPLTIQGIRMNPDHADETIVAEPDPLGTIFSLAVDPGDHRVLYVAAGQPKQARLLMSKDSGRSWHELNSLPEEARHIWIDPHSAAESRTLYLAGPHFVTIRSASGLRPLPMPAEHNDVALGFGVEDKPMIYCTSSKGLFTSNNGGTGWEKADLPGAGAQLGAVATSLHHPEVAYVSYSRLAQGLREWMGVARTRDAGKSWQLVWKESEKPAANVQDAWISERFGPGWSGNPLELGVAEQDPDLAYSTDLGRSMRTSDGGASWIAVYSRRAGGGEWASTGLDVTTNYGIHFDPFDQRRQFISYTDIGLFRSEDGGKSWQSSTAGVPASWVNTTYWIVFDPKIRGRVWSVNSGTHDLPRPKMWRKRSVLDYKGGVCRSDDGGKTWVKSNGGMEETAPTHILLDSSSPVSARVLYVAAFGRGVYKSIDGGRSWTLKNKGIADPQPLAWRLAQDSSGTLYVILARRSENGSIGDDGDGQIYRSRDGAETWEKVPLPSGVNGPNGLAIDPRSRNRLYLAAWARAAGMHGDGGGIFISEDGGRSWRIALDRDRHIYDVTIDPHNPDILYAAGFESSAWRSSDCGKHWTRIAGFNFKWAHRVIPDPGDPNSIYVTTFGGSVWHGTTNGKGAALDIATPEMSPGRF